MRPPFLEVTFRRGRPLAAYVRLAPSRVAGATTREVFPGLLVDVAPSGEPQGLEILAFDPATLAKINDVLASFGKPALSDKELEPLRAA